MVRPPTARIGPISPDERKAIMASSPVKGKYDTTIDSESASERCFRSALRQRSDDQKLRGGGVLGQLGSIVGTIFGTDTPRGKRPSTTQVIARDVTRTRDQQGARRRGLRSGASPWAAHLADRSARALVRGALGGLLRR